MHDLQPDDEYICTEMEAIRQAIALEENEGTKKWTSVFQSDILKTRRRVGLAWFALFMNQMSGMVLSAFTRYVQVG